MKRRLLLFAAFLAFSPFIFGQTFIWEAFNAGQMPPTGWTLDGYAAQWSVGNSNVAGGDAPEAIAAWNLHPVMVMDVSERVAAVDFGRDRHRYFDALLEATDWKVVARNLEDAMSRTPAGSMR